MNDKITDLVHLSKYVGMRFDLVQAGGGNTSVKINEREMLVKSSGFSLSEVELDRGWTRVDLPTMIGIIEDPELKRTEHKHLREKLCTEKIRQGTLFGNKASIEVLLHALLDTYVVHVHALAANVLLLQKDWIQQIEAIFDPATCGLVGYKTPGIELAWALQELIQHRSPVPPLIFLQNH